ncbi:hypothetical protein TNCV_2316591 [Trichonephila clavipes]|nr:hypothetical protein TNCV_2316591 [Trichonephila clavipes]
MTTEQTDQERYTEAYLDFHKSWENRMNTCVNNLNNCRTSEEATTVIRAIEEIDTQLREFPSIVPKINHRTCASWETCPRRGEV